MVIVTMFAFLGCPVVVLIALGSVRTALHRVARAHGDPGIAGKLEALAKRGTRSVAAVAVDMENEPTARFAFIDADEDTVFEIGSITKALTGMLLAEAVERGELSLDTAVGAVIPQLNDRPLGSVTLRELCTHTSGLPRMARNRWFLIRALAFVYLGWNPYRGIDLDALLDAAAAQELAGGGHQRYSNLGGAVTGQILAVAAGTDYPSLLQERILNPIGMKASSVSSPARAAPRGWTPGGRRRQPWIQDGYAPAGGVIATIGDMARLAIALLDGSAPGIGSLAPIVSVRTGGTDRFSGMFWVIDSVPGTDQTKVWHNGQTGGYSAFLALYPETRLAVVVLANLANGSQQEHIADGIARFVESGRHEQVTPGD